MRNKLLFTVVIIALFTLTVSGCTTKGIETGSPQVPSNQTLSESPVVEPEVSKPETFPEPETVAEPEEEPLATDYLKVYRNFLDYYYYLIEERADHYDYDQINGIMGVIEATQNLDVGEALERVGYAIQDISGDGIDELLIGAIEETDDSSTSGHQIFAAYTAINEIPQFVFEGFARSRYSYLGSGDFLYQGSGGAMYSVFGTYTITPDGTALSAKDYYFTYEKDASAQEVGFYHNTSGDWDPALSEELLITAEEFWQVNSEFEKEIEKIEFIPFSDYTPELFNDDFFRDDSHVYVHFEEDVIENISEYEEFIADTSEPFVRIVFSTDETIENFSILSLTLQEIDEEGQAGFSIELIYELEELTVDRPLIMQMSIFGTIPAYGISYTNSRGATRYFTIEQSGMDGSVFLSEFIN